MKYVEKVTDEKGIFLQSSLNSFSWLDKMSLRYCCASQWTTVRADGCLLLGAFWPHPPPILPTPALAFIPPNIPSSVTFPAAGLVCSFVLARPLPGWRYVEVCAMLVAAMTDRWRGIEFMWEPGLPGCTWNKKQKEALVRFACFRVSEFENWFFIQRLTPAALTLPACVSLRIDLNISSLRGSGAETWYKCKAKCIWYWSAATRAIHAGCPSLAARTEVALRPSLAV